MGKLKKTPTALFESTDYRIYVRERLAALPNGGRGEYRKIAKHLKMHTTLVSQVFTGRKNLTSEQGQLLCDHLGLSSLESEYFLRLVDLHRAGTASLRSFLQKQLEKIKRQSLLVTNRIPTATELSSSEKAIFYSSWHYSAIRLLTDIPGFQDVSSIASRLGLSLARTSEILDFLVHHGLCRRQREKFILGPNNTHLSAESALVFRHHHNWRQRVLAHAEELAPHELMFTGPLTVSQENMTHIRNRLLELIGEISKTVKKSSSEQLAYLGIDWLEIQ
jgi:uncharacterized protein (TIGR02147 family)